MNYIFFIGFLFTFSSFTSKGQSVDFEKYGIDVDGHLPSGLKTGEIAPNFSGYDQHGNFIELDSIIKDQMVVIIFYRGVWCPVCMRYLSNLQDSLQYLKSKGVSVVAITPEVSTSIESTTSKTKANFIIISDSTDQIMKDYDVWFNVTDYYELKVNVGRMRSVKENNDQEDAILPVPATFLINNRGEVIYKHFDLNYKNRASVRDILEHL